MQAHVLTHLPRSLRHGLQEGWLQHGPRNPGEVHRPGPRILREVDWVSNFCVYSFITICRKRIGY